LRVFIWLTHRLVLIAALVLVAPVAVAVATSSKQINQTGYDIAFVAKRDAGNGIHVMRGDGANVTLVRTESTALLVPSSWSPDGKRIAYCAFGAEDEDLLKKYQIPIHFPLYVVNADGSGRERLLDVPVEPSFRWSPDGRRLVFSSGYEDPSLDNPLVRRGQQAGSVAIYVLDLQSRKTIRLTGLGQNRFASWSPDGLRIAFSGDTDAGNRDIHVIDADGNNLRRLTTETTVDVQPEWSPRGELIAYVAAPRPADRGTEGGVFVMKPDGSGARRIWAALASGGVWSPDGTDLLIHSSPSTLVDVATGAATKPLPQGALDGTFAPDGRSILYRLREEGPQAAWSIYAIDLQGQNGQRLTSSASTFSVSPLLRGAR
jgi:Tol biopolymer transport system component